MKSIHFFVFCLAFSACNNTETASTTPAPEGEKRTALFDDLVGTWQNDDGKSFERWSKTNDSTFESAVYSLNGTDTVWSERAKVFQQGSRWIFENNVSGQNAGQSVQFASILLTDHTVQFSNPQHDFPTDINYTIVDSVTLHAFTVGPNQKGQRDTIPFNYHRLVPAN